MLEVELVVAETKLGPLSRVSVLLLPSVSVSTSETLVKVRSPSFTMVML